MFYDKLQVIWLRFLGYAMEIIYILCMILHTVAPVAAALYTGYLCYTGMADGTSLLSLPIKHLLATADRHPGGRRRILP